MSVYWIIFDEFIVISSLVDQMLFDCCWYLLLGYFVSIEKWIDWGNFDKEVCIEFVKWKLVILGEN